jgi:hypothetical protein
LLNIKKSELQSILDLANTAGIVLIKGDIPVSTKAIHKLTNVYGVHVNMKMPTNSIITTLNFLSLCKRCFAFLS